MADTASTIESSNSHLEGSASRPVLDQLSFTGRRVNGLLDPWSPPEVDGKWDEQIRVGEDIAREAVEYIAKSGERTALRYCPIHV